MDLGESRQKAMMREHEYDNESSVSIERGVVDRILASH